MITVKTPGITLPVGTILQSRKHRWDFYLPNQDVQSTISYYPCSTTTSMMRDIQTWCVDANLEREIYGEATIDMMKRRVDHTFYLMTPSDGMRFKLVFGGRLGDAWI